MISIKNHILDVVDRKTLLSVLLLSFFISLLSLIIPIAAQTLVNIVAFGKLLQPVLVISIVVLVMMLASGFLSIWQAIVIEVIQQKMFAHTSLRLAKHLPNLDLNSLSEHRGPELVNRYFDVMTVKKALANLLIYGMTAILQIIFGLILLLIYHPFFIYFDLFLIVSSILIIKIPHKKALAFAHQECAQKHINGAWLEELMHQAVLFKMMGARVFGVEQTDKRVVDFLVARNRHFRMWLWQLGGIHILSAFAASFLLGIGGYLVIYNQMSLGQLVAAEIVLGGLIQSLKSIAVLMRDYYDLRASEHKVDTLLDMPSEREVDINSKNFGLSDIQTMVPEELKISHFTRPYDESPPLNFTMKKGEPLVVYGMTGTGKSLLINEIAGISHITDLELYINDHHLPKGKQSVLRKRMLVLRNIDIFVGSLIENITLSETNDVDLNRLWQIIESLNLTDAINKLPEGINSKIVGHEHILSSTEQKKLMFARALYLKPSYLLVDNMLDGMGDYDRNHLAHVLKEQGDMLILITTASQSVLELFEHRVVLTI